MSRWIGIVCEVADAPEFLAVLPNSKPPSPRGGRRAYRLFADNPDQPSLRFKELASHDDLWTVRITEQSRAVGEQRGDSVIWVWIGTHNDFDNLFG